MLGGEAGGAYALVHSCVANGDTACKGRGKANKGVAEGPAARQAADTCIDAAGAGTDGIGPPPRLR